MSLRFLGFLLFLVLVKTASPGEDPEKDRLLPIDELWTHMLVEPPTLHDNVVIIEKYIKQIDLIITKAAQSDQEKKMLAEWLKKEWLLKFREQAKATLNIYKDSPEENPSGRKTDMKILNECIQKMESHLEQIMDKKNPGAEDSKIRRATLMK